LAFELWSLFDQYGTKAKGPRPKAKKLQSQAFAPSAPTKFSWSLMDLQAPPKPQNPFVFTKIGTFVAASETKKL
jgi:hypothetical protein